MPTPTPLIADWHQKHGSISWWLLRAKTTFFSFSFSTNVGQFASSHEAKKTGRLCWFSPHPFMCQSVSTSKPVLRNQTIPRESVAGFLLLPISWNNFAELDFMKHYEIDGDCACFFFSSNHMYLPPKPIPPQQSLLWVSVINLTNSRTHRRYTSVMFPFEKWMKLSMAGLHFSHASMRADGANVLSTVSGDNCPEESLTACVHLILATSKLMWNAKL